MGLSPALVSLDLRQIARITAAGPTTSGPAIRRTTGACLIHKRD